MHNGLIATTEIQKRFAKEKDIARETRRKEERERERQHERGREGEKRVGESFSNLFQSHNNEPPPPPISLCQQTQH